MASIVQTKHGTTNGSGQITLNSAPTAGNVLVYFLSRRSGAPDAPTVGPSWTQHPHGSITPGSDGARMGYRTVGSSESATIYVANILGGPVTVWELDGVGTTPDDDSNADVDTLTKPSTVNAGTLTPTGGVPAIFIAGLCVHSSDYGGNGTMVFTAGSGFTYDYKDEITAPGGAHPVSWYGHQLVTSTSGSYLTTQNLVGAGNNFGGWGGLALAFTGTAIPPDPGSDVGVSDPDGVFIADIPDAYNKVFRVELDGTGQFSFAINRYSAFATAAILARDNVVKFTVNQVSADAIFAGFLEVGDFDLNSKDEQGGEELRFGGRGLLAYLERDVAWTTSYVLETEPTDGFWRFAPASHPSWSTGNEPGQILKRIIDEMQHASRPQHCMSLLVEDFDYQDDTDGNAWSSTDATNPVWEVAVGEDVLTTTGRLVATGVINVQMDPDFGFHAYNHYGRDLTGAAFGANVVRFVKGSNIADRVNRQWSGADIAPYELVAGDPGSYVRAELPGFATMVQKVVFNQFSGTNNPTLEALGLADLEQRLIRSESAAFAIAVRRIGGTEDADTDGRYLPGPPGTLGDFWVGDTVRLVTGSTDIDYDEAEVRVAAITIGEDDAGNLTVIPELGSATGQATGALGGPTYSGGGGIAAPPGGTGTAPGATNDHGHLFGLADDDHIQYIQKALLTTQDDIIVRNATVPARLAKGSDGQVLTVDPTTHHLVWATPSSGFADPMTTRGDVIVRNASNVTARLGVGGSGTYLGSNGTDVSWSTPSGGGGSLTQAYVGYNTVGGSQENWTPGRVLAKKVTLANACLLTSIEANVDGGVNNNNVDGFMVGVYADSSGTPSELIAIGGQPGTTVLLDNNGATAAGNTVKRWLSAPIGKWLVAADYWIAVGNGDQPNSAALRISYDATGSDRYYTPGGTWFADWGNYTPTTSGNQYSIRANTIR